MTRERVSNIAIAHAVDELNPAEIGRAPGSSGQGVVGLRDELQHFVEGVALGATFAIKIAQEGHTLAARGQGLQGSVYGSGQHG